MWFIIQTVTSGENKSIAFLKEHYPEVISDYYFPLGRKIYRNEEGSEKVRFMPLLSGLFFIRTENRKALERNLSHHGYFEYVGYDIDRNTGETVERTFFTRARLLCADRENYTLREIIDLARIPDADMERFIYYNEQIAEDIQGLSIVDKSYDDLILENDTIRILNGPLKGWVGVVKQIKKNGKKDRHFLVRFGNNRCLNISNIRQYDIQVEHEATRGAKSEAVGVWRAIDQLIGYLQFRNPEEDAAATLRRLFEDYQKKLKLHRGRNQTDKAYSIQKSTLEEAQKKEVLDHIDEAMHPNFRILAAYFKTDNATMWDALNELIPDVLLRPFLTPSTGIPISAGQEYAAFWHNGIVELVLRCHLRDFFRSKEYEADKFNPVFDEDYEYDAHIALLPNGDGRVKAITSWGAFYEKYAMQNEEERQKFLLDLENRKYPRLLHLLTQNRYRFEKVGQIGGFSMDLDIPYTEDIQEMARKAVVLLQSSDGDEPGFISQTTAAAVEMWQGARLLMWRQLLQRYVLLHKVPVADLPSVIASDIELEEKFKPQEGRLQIEDIAQALRQRQEQMTGYLASGQLQQAAIRFLAMTKVISAHFAKDELYNYIRADFNPNETCTALFDAIIQQSEKQESVVNYLYKGMVELQEEDAWTYFKYPSFLQKTKAVSDRIRKTATAGMRKNKK